MHRNDIFEGFNRRIFLSLMLKSFLTLGLGDALIGCTTFDPTKDYTKLPLEEFDIKAFDSWYKRNKLYNKMNPNLKGMHQHGYYPTFKQSVFSGFGVTPGMDYSANKMVAIAPGEVGRIKELNTGRLGGIVITVKHDPYVSRYAHLDKPAVKPFQKVKRGDVLASVRYRKNAKLMLIEGANYIDPDNYGAGHGFMDYFEKAPVNTDVDPIERFDKDARIWRLNKQMNILDDFVGFWDNDDKYSALSRYHVKYKWRQCKWSVVERFKYLSTLYGIKQNLFPNLSKNHFEEMQKNFYENQSIIATLPVI